jgi:hypothetical protein
VSKISLKCLKKKFKFIKNARDNEIARATQIPRDTNLMIIANNNTMLKKCPILIKFFCSEKKLKMPIKKPTAIILPKKLGF